MPKSGKRSKNRGKKAQRQVVDVTGMLRGVGIPMPRLPFLIGSATNLSADQSVYPKMVRLDFPIIPQFQSIAAGNLSAAIAVDANVLCELATDFYALFQEYCLVGATFELRINPVAVPSGLYLAYIDEKSSSGPTAAEALSRPHVEGLVLSTESPSKHVLSWKARDYLDLQWSATATAGASPAVPCYLKIFTNTASTGTSATTTGQICITGAISLCFRGFAE
jgi:hypothetical protein